MTDLLILAEAQIAEKQVQEIEKIKERLAQDKEVLKEAIELVNSHTLYKKVEDKYSHGIYKYVLATEEMLKNDYLGEPKSFSYKGIRFKWDDRKCAYDKGIMEVNGHTYYDIRWALNNYERMIREKTEKIQYLNSKVQELEEDLSSLHRNFPTLKQAITEWMEYQKADEEGADE